MATTTFVAVLGAIAVAIATAIYNFLVFGYNWSKRLTVCQAAVATVQATVPFDVDGTGTPPNDSSGNSRSRTKLFCLYSLARVENRFVFSCVPIL
jgi:hypothetical protein